MGFLVLSRRVDEDIVITVPPSSKPMRITMKVIEAGYSVRLGFRAHCDVMIHRGEIQEQRDQQEREAAESKRGDG